MILRILISVLLAALAYGCLVSALKEWKMGQRMEAIQSSLIAPPLLLVALYYATGEQFDQLMSWVVYCWVVMIGWIGVKYAVRAYRSLKARDWHYAMARGLIAFGTLGITILFLLPLNPWVSVPFVAAVAGFIWSIRLDIERVKADQTKE